MAADNNQVLLEGFLDVKAPRGSNERTLMKVWRRLWANFSIARPTGRGEPLLVLQLSRDRGGAPEKYIRASRDGLRLFRCRSASRPLSTWALASGHSMLMYFAAAGEVEAQRWMRAVRNGLWPPILSERMMNTQHEVSLIDDEKSFSIGILGTYGRLICSTGDVISLLHPHWGGVLMRWQVADIQDVRLVRTVGETSGVFNVLLKNDGGDGSRTFQFYSDCAESTISWIQGLLSEKNSGSYLKMNDIKPQKPILNDKIGADSVTPSCKSESSTAKQNTALQDTPNEVMMHLSPQSEGASYGKINRTIKQLKDIPDDFLDASISSAYPCNRNDSGNSSDDDEFANSSNWTDFNQDLEENVYEEINLEHSHLKRTESVGGVTLYENIDFSDDEYVPPLPPELPKRPVSSQTDQQEDERLKTLSESVMAALKQAEGTPPPSPRSSRKNIVNRAVRKCKSLHVGSMHSNGSRKEAALKKISSQRRNSDPNTKA